jgi:hypothetical protein
MQGVREALLHDLSSKELRRISNHYERGTDVPTSMGWPPYMFKKLQQIRNFDKRIIWPSDKSFETLSKEAFIGFIKSQREFGLPEPMSRRVSRVLHRSADICQLILGKFDFDEWFDSCSFGKRAAFKLPRSKAYLDTRLRVSSGTPSQHVAYNAALARDVHLFRTVRKGDRPRKVYHKNKATAVPKSFKAARIIAPDMILGGFLSRGLGDLIRHKLEKETHIDLAIQQERHRRWARRASVNGLYATIDMSKASDSFTWRHLECIVPKSWIEALRVVWTPTIDVGGTEVELASCMLMGSGHTFPLQTLLFYCLAEATRSLLNCRGKVSVYGDDIIVPVQMSRHFRVIMEEIGFVINSDKSFYDEPDPDRPSHSFFRESCGGDYKGGVDVRPYMPECDLQSKPMVPRNEYAAWCHKLINGLLDHWDACEIGTTLNYLLHETERRTGFICLVPKWEVDHAGIKHYIPPYLTIGMRRVEIRYDASHPSYWRLTFSRRKRRRQIDERAYVWYAYFLQSRKVFSARLPLLYELLRKEERAKLIQSYETVVSLNGEPNRSRKGEFRWRKFGPKDFK